jgi:hypothetical protein
MIKNRTKYISGMLLLIAITITALVLYFGGSYGFIPDNAEGWIIYVIATVIVATDAWLAIYIMKRTDRN